MLQIYMDSFHGCYEDTIRDYRHFTTLYVAVRFLHLLISSVFNYNLYLPAAALLIVFTLALVAKFQPYKCKRSNTVDIILLLITISGYISSSMYYAGPVGFMYPKWLGIIVSSVFVLILLFYLVFLILVQVLPKAVQCFMNCKTLLKNKIKPSNKNMEDRALLNH